MKAHLLLVTGLVIPLTVMAQTVSPGPTPTADTNLLQPTITITPPSPRDVAWAGVLAAIGAPGGGAVTPADALNTANVARDFYVNFPKDPNATEARQLEAIFLIQAADGGDSSIQTRMLAAVQGFRTDKSVSEFQRAVVAGTYEFHALRQRVKTFADLAKEHEAVARGLMQEFPDQPQGYVSLLTVAMRTDDAVTARALAQEVAGSATAPAEARLPAQRFVTRLDLVGQPVGKVFGNTPLGPTAKAGWPADRPGLIYIWATGSPDSVALGEKLAGLQLTAINVVGVCLDADPTPGAATAAAHKLPGRLVYAAQFANGNLAQQLGADQAPLLFLVDAQGRITDVRGLNNLDAKIAGLGL